MSSRSSDFVESATNVFNKVEHAAEQAAHAILDEVAAVGHQTMLFGKGAVSGAVLNPINGAEQLLNKLAGTNLPPLEFSNQDEVNHSWAGKAGQFGGTVLAFIATDGAVSAVSGVARGGAASLAITGGIHGGVLSRSDSTKEGTEFIRDRLQHATIDAVTFATMGGASKKLAPIFDGVGETVLQRMSIAAGKDGVSGAVAGVVNAEATAILKEGRLATTPEVLTSAATNMVFGMGMGALGEVVTSVAEVLKPGIEAKPLSEAELAATRTRLQKLIQLDNNVSPEFVARTTKSLERIHDSLLETLEKEGVKIRLTPKVTDADPSLAGASPRGWESGTWEKADGLYNPSTREIIIAETYQPISWMRPIKSTRTGVARHETGHGLDDAMGLLSRSKEFQSAHSADVANIPKEWRSRLDYFIQPLGPSAGRSEAFAELFAVLHGGPCSAGMARLLRQHFPNTLKVMAETMEGLK